MGERIDEIRMTEVYLTEEREERVGGTRSSRWMKCVPPILRTPRKEE